MSGRQRDDAGSGRLPRFGVIDVATSTLRLIDLLGQTDPNPGSGEDSPGSHGGLTFTGKHFAATFADSSADSSNLNRLYQATHPQDVAQPIAVTYLVGCP